MAIGWWNKINQCRELKLNLTNLSITFLVKLTQIHCSTSSGKSCMTRLCAQHSPTLTYSNLMQSPLLNSVANGPCQMWLLRIKNKFQKIGRVQYTQHTKRFSYMTCPATCPLCGGSGSAPHMLLRCNNHILKRMHMNGTTTQLAVVVKRSVRQAGLSSRYYITVKS